MPTASAKTRKNGLQKWRAIHVITTSKTLPRRVSISTSCRAAGPSTSPPRWPPSKKRGTRAGSPLSFIRTSTIQTLPPSKQEISSTTDCTSLRKHSSLFAWLQLLRLPNVFTAVADVVMGYLVACRGELQSIENLAVLAVVSILLYLSGMVLNDVFDAEVDA